MYWHCHLLALYLLAPLFSSASKSKTHQIFFHISKHTRVLPTVYYIPTAQITHTALQLPLICLLVRDHALHLVNAGGEATELHLLTVHNVPGIGILPLLWHDGRLVRVHQQIEAAGFVQEGEEGNRRGNLADDGLNLIVNFLDGLAHLLGRTAAGAGALVGYRSIVLVSSLLPVGAGPVINADVELPPLEGFAGIDPGNDHHEALDVTLQQPRFHLAHDLVKVLEQTLIGSCQDGQTILGLALEGFRLVNSCIHQREREREMWKDESDDVCEYLF